MKTILASLLLALSGWSATVTWDAPTDGVVHHYRVYQWVSNDWVLLRSVTNATSTSFTNGPGVRLGFTAVSPDGWESEMATSDNPGKPLRIRLTLQSSSDPSGPFGDVTNVLADIGFVPSAFYRGKLTIENN